MRVNDEDFLRYYWEELLYLRRLGASFAKSYPKVAARLELESDESPDPHVERLIESFAFLTARIQRNLDNDFPEIAAELLGVLYPHLVDPVPSMTVVRFDVDPARGKLTSGYPVPRHTPLFVHAEGGAICRFRTCFPVDLWPVELTEASFHSPDRYAFLDRAGEVATVLALTIETRADPLHELDMDRLRVHLAGDQILAEGLYELLFNNLLGVVLLPDDAEGRPDTTRPRRLHPSAVQPVGFAEEEALLPYPVHAQPAYRLIQELFAFPEKYRFLDVTGLERHGASRRLTMLFLFDRMPTPRLTVSRSNFVLHATPAINLFEKTSEPIRVDHRRLEYRLVADRRREKTTEVHSVISVSSSSTPPGKRGGEPSGGGEGVREFAPFYAFHHGMERRGQKAYWHARRVLSLYQDVTGTEMLLSFLDLDFKPGQPPADTVFAHTLCTNRALAEQLPAGTELQSDQVAPVSRIVCLKKPTAQLTPPLGGQSLWRLVSHLSLNYLSLSTGEESLHGLQEILRLYCVDESPVARQQIAGISALSQRRVARQVGGWGDDGAGDGWRGFCRGLEVTLTFDESLYVGSSAFLFASVLNRFLGLYAPTNSFTQLRIRSLQREGEWKRWPPMVGARPFR